MCYIHLSGVLQSSMKCDQIIRSHQLLQPFWSAVHGQHWEHSTKQHPAPLDKEEETLHGGAYSSTDVLIHIQVQTQLQDNYVCI